MIVFGNFFILILDISWQPVIGIDARVNVSLGCHVFHDAPADTK